jgi:hypothetical protein
MLFMVIKSWQNLSQLTENSPQMEFWGTGILVSGIFLCKNIKNE